jgi:hypothetical protein
MRNDVAAIAVRTASPTLEGVRNQFETWRKKRLCQGRIREALWQAAVELCKEHPVFTVSRSLRLHYTAINRSGALSALRDIQNRDSFFKDLFFFGSSLLTYWIRDHPNHSLTLLLPCPIVRF